MHTKGPWDRTAIYAMIRFASKQMIEIPGDEDMAIPNYSNDADMDLIAAAPDLLEALKEAADSIETFRDPEPSQMNEVLDEMIYPAIAKAETVTEGRG